MGYVVIDNRSAGGALVEFDTEHCRHCQALIDVQQHRREGAWCGRCAGPVCPTPACADVCNPFMRQVEAQIRRDAFARTAGLVEK